MSYLPNHTRIVGSLIVAALVWPAAAAASPWTLPNDSLSLNVRVDTQFADREFLPENDVAGLPSGQIRDFPLDGQFRATNLNLDVTYGITDRLEAAMSFSLKNITYKADPAVLYFDVPNNGETTIEAAPGRGRLILAPISSALAISIYLAVITCATASSRSPPRRA